MVGNRSLLHFYNILVNYGISYVETWSQISIGGKVHFSLPFPIYFTLETKSKFSTTREERGVEDIFIINILY
jgi:hypothetical protein